MTITAAADGSALGNPGPAGWAWYIDEHSWRAGGWPHGTNNMGELKAVLDLLEATAADADQHLIVLCDSQYVINSVTRWMPGWKRKGWRKKDGKPVLNVELLQAIDRALAGRSVEFEWVKGHAGHALNEAADERARAAATAFSKGQDPRIGPGYRASTSQATAAVAPSAPEIAAPTAPATIAPSAPAPAPTLFDDLAATEAPAATPATATVATTPTTAETTATPATSIPLTTALEDVVARELLLLRPDVRGDRDRARLLLHPAYTGIRASGDADDREQFLDALAPVTALEATDIVADEIASGVVLIRYVSRSADGVTARCSSIWVQTDGEWLLRHHQGTPT
ncbi:ribonuclease HI family protein [Brachybacterium timonense]|uniref:ribonuclease HI family protein n=1 Tax=Brachybacterium timonense TaxID=2050896 RepID=UPI000D0B4019|nr:ribonuclease HI family protein [Brachybacterium timonense]